MNTQTKIIFSEETCKVLATAIANGINERFENVAEDVMYEYDGSFDLISESGDCDFDGISNSLLESLELDYVYVKYHYCIDFYTFEDGNPELCGQLLEITDIIISDYEGCGIADESIDRITSLVESQLKNF